MVSTASRKYLRIITMAKIICVWISMMTSNIIWIWIRMIKRKSMDMSIVQVLRSGMG